MASVTFRLSYEDKVVLQEGAERFGMSLSEFCREGALFFSRAKTIARDAKEHKGPVVIAEDQVLYHCPRRCGWKAPSPNARCPDHPGKTHAL